MKNENKTIPTPVDVSDFLATIDDEQQRRDSEVLVEMMHDVSGEPPVMWGASIVGFGKFTYKYASGREGEWMQIGFSPRKGKMSLYVTYDASQFTTELNALGKHKIGKGCIYINRLADVDLQVLRQLVEHAYKKGFLGDETK